MSDYYGGIEAGGTKFVCVIANNPDDILAEKRFPTTSPEETINNAILFFIDNIKHHDIKLKSLGIGSFGPIDLNPASATYGCITSTPKKGWRDINLVQPIQEKLQIPILFDTDVNAAAVGEGKWGAARDVENFLYFTIGTGIGGGAIINGKPLHGLIHPEMGHIILNQNQLKDRFIGSCPFHRNCFEGLASGPAIEERWGSAANNLEINHPAWELEADYIAQAMSNYICCFSPQKIILGGGVMQQLHLFPMIQKKTVEYLNGYIQSDMIMSNMDQFIIRPGLGNQAGMLGAIALAQAIYP
ncbi:MAG TPA: ROK family protein [Anaerolineaceae bacterium]|nr:ROK family protein [Anaerolineaceae bacterium]